MNAHIHFATVLLTIGLLPSTLFAQETTDSTASDKNGKTRELQELVVEGDLSTSDARGVTYVPTARQKRVAQTLRSIHDRLWQETEARKRDRLEGRY